MNPHADDRYHIPSTTEEIKLAYNENASVYALFEPVAEYLGLRRVRRRLVRRAAGDVLEVAVGTGLNLKYYPDGCRITAVDVSEAMLERAREHAGQLGREVTLHLMDAEHLNFPDDHFDTVVSTMSTCTFIDPVAVLREMSRVCRPEGQILLMEHGRSSTPWLARWQDRRAGKHARQFGCHWNREPHALAQEAGLTRIQSSRHFFGVFHEVVAHPTPVPQAV